MSSRTVLTVGVVLVGLAALLAAGYWAIFGSPPQATEERAEAPQGPPQLECVFIGFTGTPRLAAVFNLSRDGNQPQFEQIYLAELDGSRRRVKEPPFPRWQFDASDEPARLESEIEVFDNMTASSHTEDIAIEFYNYRPERRYSGLIEVGLRNNHYKNLSGSCRQSRSLPAGSADK